MSHTTGLGALIAPALITAVAAITSALLAAAPAPNDPAGPPLRHRIVDAEIVLRPDPHRVVVLGRDGIVPSPTDGAVTDRNAPALPPGWAVWSLPQRDVANEIAMLTQRDDIVFASPLLRCDRGWWRIPMPDLLVGLVADVDETGIAALLAEFGLDAANVHRADEWALRDVLRIATGAASGAAVLQLADALSDHPLVRFAEPDMLMQAEPGGTPASVSDPQFPSQWYLDDLGQVTACGDISPIADIDVNAPEAWAMTQGSAEVIVLVIDNGIQFDHPDLLGDATLGFDPTPAAGGGWPVDPCDNHGTAVVGAIAALTDNAVGIAGLAPGVRFASARISMPSVGCTVWTVQSSWVAASLAWGESVGATISNTSWSFLPSAIITEAYAQRAANGMLHFACSHNQGAPSVTFPASLPTVVAVGAVNRSGNLAGFSNWGVAQELVAPGTQFRTTDRTGSAGYGPGAYACTQGTSFASPLAAGAAALVRSANPTLTAEQVRAILQASATDLGQPGWDIFTGHGLVRADAAVAAAIAMLPDPADLDGDGIVGGTDLGVLLNAWSSGDPMADLNGDGVVDGADLGILLNAWNG